LIDNYLTRKEKITITSIQILDEKGIKGLTTREIASRQNITEPAIYRHFSSKKKIILSIIEKFKIFDELISSTIMENNMAPLEALRYYIESFSKYYENYPEITTVMFSLDVYGYDEELKDEMFDTFSQRDELIRKIIEKGQEEKLFIKNISSKYISEMIIDILWGTIKRWKLEGCKTNLTLEVMEKINWFIEKEVSLNEKSSNSR
jgi:AcrR family transcriptional regulator